MSMSQHEVPAAPGKVLNLDKEEKEAPQPKTMGDLPPELLTTILERVTRNEGRNNMVIYRLVNSQWKGVIDSLIEGRIVSGEFQVFPGGLKIMVPRRQRQYGQLHVNTSSRLFGPSGNRFPFNSLLLNGKPNAPDFYSTAARRRIPMTLPEFASKYGGNLTSLAIYDRVIPIESLCGMLAGMPNLKMISLADVKQENVIIKPDAVLPTAPPLPSLTSLELKSDLVNHRPRDDKRNIMYVWLIASYADQLECLNLVTKDPLPAFQRSHQYAHLLPKQKSCCIAATSDSAFGKLKELAIYRPTKTFLTLSEFPSLQRLSVTGLARQRQQQADLVNLALFIEKCKETLEKLYLDIPWSELVNPEVGVSLRVGQQLLPTGGVVVPKLKTLAINYPFEEYQERILKNELLSMFPVLNGLQLLNFHPNCFDNANGYTDDETQAIELENENGNIIVALKERLITVRNLLHDLWHMDLMLRERWLLEQHQAAVPANREQRAAQLRLFEAIEEGMDAPRNEMRGIYGRLTAMGERRETVIVELMLRRQGLWNAYANLKSISVSSGGKPEGNIALMRRTDDAQV